MHQSLRLDYFHIGDVLQKSKLLPDKCVRCVITSPPYYGLRDYLTATWLGGDSNCDHLRISKDKSVQTALAKSTLSGGKKNQEVAYADKRHSKGVCKKCGAVRIDQQIGLELSPELYIEKLVAVFRECWRILTDDGTLWINIADSYWGGKGQSGDARPDIQAERLKNGESISKVAQSIGEKGKTSPLQGKHSTIKPRDLIGIPWMLAFALRNDGWYLRSEIIVAKTNPMPESVTNRPTKSHEYIFLLTKHEKYYYDYVAILTTAKNPEDNVRRIMQQKENNKSNPDDMKNGLRPRNSGNLERKDRPGAPEDNGKHQMGSVPWKGTTANKRSVWTVSTKPFKGAHFATFSEDLIIDCLKAGTSDHGRCSKCGRPWIRIVEKELKPTAKASYNTYRDDRDDLADDNDQGSNRVKDGHMPGYYNDYTTTGWKPTCHCKDAAVIPDVVLDPFSGAGTTALVAKKLHRNFIGIELNEMYVKKISIPRLKSELGFFYTPQTDFE